MNLQQAELEKRSKELDAREAFIDEKAKLLEEGPLTLKVYEAKVNAYEKRSNDLLEQIKVSEERQRELDSVYNSTVTKLEERKGLENKELIKLEDKVKDSRQVFRKLKEDQDSITIEIGNRKDYLEELENTISATTEVGNNRLLDINDEISKKEIESRQLAAKLTNLKSDYDILVIDYSKQSTVYEDEIKILEDNKHRITVEIDALTTKLSEKSQEYRETTADIDNKLAQLKEKETSIIAQRDAIKLAESKLNTEKRRWDSTKELYNIK